MKISEKEVDQSQSMFPVARVLIDFDLDGEGWWLLHPLSEWLRADASDDAKSLAKSYLRTQLYRIRGKLNSDLQRDLRAWNDTGVRLYSAHTRWPSGEDERESLSRGLPVGDGSSPTPFQEFWREGDLLAKRARFRLPAEYDVWIITPDIAYRRVVERDNRRTDGPLASEGGHDVV